MEELVKQCLMEMYHEGFIGGVQIPAVERMIEPLSVLLGKRLKEKGALPPSTENMDEQANKYAATVMGLTGNPYVSKAQVTEDFAAGWQAREQAQ